MRNKKLSSRINVIFPLVLAVSLVISFVVLMREQREVDATRNQVESLKAEIEAKKKANHEQAADIKRMQEDREYVEKVARNELDMARPDETIYFFKDPEKPKN